MLAKTCNVMKNVFDMDWEEICLDLKLGTFTQNGLKVQYVNFVHIYLTVACRYFYYYIYVLRHKKTKEESLRILNDVIKIDGIKVDSS